MIRVARKPKVTKGKARVRRRATGGNIGAKNCFHCRSKCCEARKSLSQPPDWYTAGNKPKCPSCGKRAEWRRDRYRDRVELAQQLCKCSSAPYPHRRGSAAAGGTYGRWECEHHVPF